MRVNVTRELLARAILFNAHELPSYNVKQRSEQTSVTYKETKKVSQLNFHGFENKSNNVQNKINNNIFGQQNIRLQAVSLFFSDLVWGVHPGECAHAFSHARGHLRVPGVLLNGPRKKRDCSQSNRTRTYANIYIYIYKPI